MLQLTEYHTENKTAQRFSAGFGKIVVSIVRRPKEIIAHFSYQYSVAIRLADGKFDQCPLCLRHNSANFHKRFTDRTFHGVRNGHTHVFLLILSDT